MTQGIRIDQPIVDLRTGMPTDYFLRLFQGNNGILNATGQTIEDLLARQIIAGDGLDGGGPLSANVTLTAAVQEVLDQLSTTQGVVLYRGAADWAALGVGTSGQVLQTNGAAANPSWVTPSSGSGIASGTSFPGSPATSDLYFRTDRGIIYYYTGTAWHSVQLLTSGYHSDGVAQNAATAFILPPPYKQQGYSIYLESFTATSILTNGTTASNYFAFRLKTFEATGSTTTSLGSGLTSQSDTQNVWFCKSEAINATVASTIELLYPDITETGAATGFFNFSIAYRLIG